MLSPGFSENGGPDPMNHPVSSCAVSGEAKPHLRASNSFATAVKSSLRLPGRIARPWRLPGPPPRTPSPMALAAWSGRLPRMTLIASERPSASCSMTRNLALDSFSNATSWSNTSAATDDLLRQDLQRLVELRPLAVGGRDAGIDGTAKALLGPLGHQWVDAGLAQRLADQS